MATLFECEVRFTIDDIDRFKSRLAELNAVLEQHYEFHDQYFRPKHDRWNPIEKNLRIREWMFPDRPTAIYFVRNEILTIDGLQFKRSVYHHGKVPLLNDEPAVCAEVLNDLGFKAWFTLKKESCTIWDLSQHGFKTITEYIDGIGWSGELEFEGENPEHARKQFEHALTLLNISHDQVSFKPISVTYAEQHKLLDES